MSESNQFNLKYRPQAFTEFVGNTSAIEGLLKSYPDWPSTFLFVGPPGVGKTTLARLIAKQLKCDKTNVREIDAATDRGIDNIRQLTAGAFQKPLIGNSKIYIFDECQGLTKDSQEALLKITEEAPKNTYFIFCSTDPHKIIKALKARCQTGLINLKPLTRSEIGTIVKSVADREKIEFTPLVREIATLCVDHADGIPRDALMSFQKYYQYTDIESVRDGFKSLLDTVPTEVWPFINAMQIKDLEVIVKEYETLQKEDKFVHAKLSVLIANVFKKKLLKSISTSSQSPEIQYYTKLLTLFGTPLNADIFGEIEFIRRIGLLCFDDIQS